MLRIGLDIGGTTITLGVITTDGELLKKYTIDTNYNQGAEAVISRINALINQAIEESSKAKSEFEYIGIGCAGMLDRKNGIVKYSNNIGWKEVPLASLIEEKIKLPVYVANDSVCATIGEFKFGAGSVYSSFIMLTLGTGIGGGLVLDNKLYLGKNELANIMGHMVIDKNGPLCNCGRRGCFELYGSTTALIKNATLATSGSEATVLKDYPVLNGRNIFKAIREKDNIALKVFDEFTDNLAIGIANLINCLNIEAVILSGGICKEGDFLINPIKEKTVKKLYCGQTVMPEIRCAKLLDEAGIYGASLLKEFM